MRSFYAPLRAAIFSVALVGLTVLGTTAAHAQTVIYNTSASFFAAVQPGFYTETFTGTGVTSGGSPAGSFSATGFNFAGNGFTYNINATSGAFRDGNLIGSNLPNEAVTITFTSGNVTAVGGNFFNTNINSVFLANSPVTLTLNNGTTTMFTPTSVNDYRGFTSNIAITSLTYSAPGAAPYASLDNLTVGARITPSAAPEPGTLVLVGTGALPLFGIVTRRRRSKTA